MKRQVIAFWIKYRFSIWSISLNSTTSNFPRKSKIIFICSATIFFKELAKSRSFTEIPRFLKLTGHEFTQELVVFYLLFPACDPKINRQKIVQNAEDDTQP
jgi:hypothetical protein